MISRILRYNVPAAALMLQVLNHTNRADFKDWQVSFGKPTPIPEPTMPNIDPKFTNGYDLNRPPVGTLTRIDVIPSKESGWKKTQELVYRRKIIQDHFITVPFVVHVTERDPALILDALHKQFNLYLDPDLVEVTFRKVKLNDVLFKRHLGEIMTDFCSDYVPPESYNAIVKIKPEHPYWMGELNVFIREAVEFLDRPIANTLQIYHYLGPGDHNKVPAEMMLKMTGFVDIDHYVRDLKAGDFVTDFILPVCRNLTQDPWVFDRKPQPFNLYGTKVIHNGVNTGDLYIDDPRVTNVLVLEFGEECCTNIRGQWVFGYYNAETWLNRQRIDRLPIQEQ